MYKIYGNISQHLIIEAEWRICASSKVGIFSSDNDSPVRPEPVSEPVLAYYWLDLGDYIPVKFESKLFIFIQENDFEIGVYKMVVILSRLKYINNSFVRVSNSFDILVKSTAIDQQC